MISSFLGVKVDAKTVPSSRKTIAFFHSFCCFNSSDSVTAETLLPVTFLEEFVREGEDPAVATGCAWNRSETARSRSGDPLSMLRICKRIYVRIGYNKESSIRLLPIINVSFPSVSQNQIPSAESYTWTRRAQSPQKH